MLLAISLGGFQNELFCRGKNRTQEVRSAANVFLASLEGEEEAQNLRKCKLWCNYAVVGLSSCRGVLMATVCPKSRTSGLFVALASIAVIYDHWTCFAIDSRNSIYTKFQFSYCKFVRRLDKLGQVLEYFQWSGFEVSQLESSDGLFETICSYIKNCTALFSKY